MKRSSRQIGFLVPAALMLLALPACQKTQEVQVEEQPGEEILMEPTSASPVTRAMSLIENETALRGYDIRIDAYFHDSAQALFSGAKLRYQTADLYRRWMFVDNSSYIIHHYWPIEGSVHAGAGTVSSVDFVGYVPYSADATIPNTGVTIGEYTPGYWVSESYTPGAPSFSATLPVTAGDPNTFNETNQANLQEFMYAYKANQTKDSDAGEREKTGAEVGSVAMTFQHPFALVYIYLSKAKRNTKINSITLSGLKTSGTFTHGSGWNTSEGVVANLYKEVNKTIPDALNFKAIIGGPFLVIPQDLTGSTNNLTVNRTYPGNSEDPEDTANIQASITTNWQPGYIYSYYLDMGEDSGQILVDVTIEAWMENWQGTGYNMEIDVK